MSPSSVGGHPIAAPVTIKPIPLPGRQTSEFKATIVTNIVGAIVTVLPFFGVPVPHWLGPALMAGGNAVYTWARGNAKR